MKPKFFVSRKNCTTVGLFTDKEKNKIDVTTSSVSNEMVSDKRRQSDSLIRVKVPKVIPYRNSDESKSIQDFNRFNRKACRTSLIHLRPVGSRLKHDMSG